MPVTGSSSGRRGGAGSGCGPTTSGFVEGAPWTETQVGKSDRILPPPDGVELVDGGHMLHLEAANALVARLRDRLG